MVYRWRFLLCCLWLCFVACKIAHASCCELDTELGNENLLLAPKRVLPSDGSSSVTIALWMRSSHLRPYHRRHPISIPACYYVLRIILRKPPCTSSEALRQTLCWTIATLKRRRHNATVCQVHRCVNKQAPSYLNSKFMTNSTLNYACTRSSNKLHLKRPNTNFYRTTFEHIGAQLFNSLPEEIQSVKSYTNFTKALQTIDHQFL